MSLRRVREYIFLTKKCSIFRKHVDLINFIDCYEATNCLYLNINVRHKEFHELSIDSHYYIYRNKKHNDNTLPPLN